MVAQGDLAGARKQYEQALALCKEMNDDDFTAQLNASLAGIALAEKRYTDGKALAQLAIAGYEKANSPGNGAWSWALLARNLLGAGKLAEAQSAVAKAEALVRKSTSQTPHFEVELADARVKAKAGQLADARRELESTLASARKFGYRLYALQARLAMGEIELSSGSSAARVDLSLVEKDARAQGALLVANQAQALLAAPQIKAK